MKILIAGLGSIGRRHLRNLLAMGERDILLYRTGQSTLPDEELAKFPVETNLEAALAHKPEAVIIANPTSLHLDVAIPAAEAGCHLFLEKPISHTLDGIDRLVAAVKRSGARVFVGFQFRFHPSLQKINGLLSASYSLSAHSSEFSTEQPAIGRPLSVHAHWGEYLPGWHPWEDYRQSYSARAKLGGGVILTLCHPLDYLRWLFGEVEALWAFAGRLNDLDLDVEDTAEIGLRFANGVLGSLHLDYNQRPSAHFLEIVGTQGSLRWDNTDGAVSIYQAAYNHWENLPAPDGFERNDLFQAEMRHFLDVARGEAQSVCTLQDGIRCLELALAARRSAQQGQLIPIQAEA